MATKIYGLKMIEKISELFVFSFILIHDCAIESFINRLYVTVRAAFYKLKNLRQSHKYFQSHGMIFNEQNLDITLFIQLL